MAYSGILYPFRFRRLRDDSIIAVSESGDYLFTDEHELRQIIRHPEETGWERLAELHAKFFVGSADASGSLRLLASRIASKRETVLSGPSLHAIVPTLQCDHTCRYCQVSRVLDDGHAMSTEVIDRACDTIFQSPAESLTVEFQGGEPLLRFDLVKHAIERIAETNADANRRIRFVVASTLHQLTESMCDFFRKHGAYLSTSIDGPAALHNRNRPIPTKDAYERTVSGIRMARELISHDSVSALMTASRDSLDYPEAIVDEYVSLGFHDIFLRQMSGYGFAHRNADRLSYTVPEYARFYETAFDHILSLNRQGVAIKEVSAAIALNKILSPFDGGYVDLQSPTGAGLAALVYNYDGYVYPSDESRMLAEMGDTSLRLGKIGDPLATLLSSPVERDVIRASLVRHTPGCDQCAYSAYCGPDPVNAKATWGNVFAPVRLTGHCARSLWMFDFLFERLKTADEWFLDLAYAWSAPPGSREACDA